jgi:hypothetical protein
MRCNKLVAPHNMFLSIPMDLSFLVIQSLDMVQTPGEVSVEDVLPSIVEMGEEGQEEENLQFLDSNVGDKVEFNPIADNSFYNDYQASGDLANFLSRPVQISTFKWLESDSAIVKLQIDPWTLFFNDTRIKKKLDNFAYISCNLNIKVVVNASPFYYGRMIMGYIPMGGYTASTIQSASEESQKIPMSQRPRIWIDPAENKAGVMRLPFFFHKNWLRVTSASDFANMGSLDFWIYSILQSANGATGTGVDVTTYAWASDVRICGPTVGLALQSRDEYGEGPVSGVASAIAVAAGHLTKIPVLGKFATATQIGASATSSIAKLFGYTNVPVIEDVKPTKTEPFKGFPSAEIGASVEKLTLDPKCELTIDPRVGGIASNDELDIPTICQRESYLTQFNWASSDVTSTLKFVSGVHPQMNNFVGTGVSQYVNSTPMGHLQHLFAQWRGDLIYKFVFVKSKYHKGRVRITWDPVGDIVTDPLSTSVAYTQIVDLATCNEVELRVPYMQSLAWSDTKSTATNLWQTTGFSNRHTEGITNGQVTIRVLNALTGPLATANIDVMVFVKASENIEFANPVARLPNWSIFTVQSYDEESAVSVGHESSSDPHRYLINYGESIRSLRTLLRRANHIQSTTIPVGTNTYALYSRYQPRFPRFYGFDPAGLDSALGLVTPANTYLFNYVSNTPFQWISRLYIGRRGSGIWHINVDNSGTAADVVGKISTARITDVTAANNFTMTSITPASPDAYRRFIIANDVSGVNTLGGSTLTHQRSQTGVSVLFPMVNKYRFEYHTAAQVNPGIDGDGSNRNRYQVSFHTKPTATASSTNAMVVSSYFSIGTDFSVLFFLNVPTFFTYNSAIPTAA